ncbi:MAG: hypothetical protein AB1453_05395 [Chloroflexota bacterium]
MFPVLKSKRRGLAALLGLALLIGAGVYTAGGQFDPPAGSDWVSASIADLQRRLDQSANPAEQALLREKLNRLEPIQQTRQQAADVQALPPQIEDVCANLSQQVETPAPREEGLIVLAERDYEDLDLLAENGWQGWVNGSWVRVFAGQSFFGGSGRLLIFTENAPLHSIDLPAAAPLRIESASGSRLTLSDAQGVQYFFDAAARQFLSAPDEIVPSLPPLPTFTPQPGFCP